MARGNTVPVGDGSIGRSSDIHSAIGKMLEDTKSQENLKVQLRQNSSIKGLVNALLKMISRWSQEQKIRIIQEYGNMESIARNNNDIDNALVETIIINCPKSELQLIVGTEKAAENKLVNDIHKINAINRGNINASFNKDHINKTLRVTGTSTRTSFNNVVNNVANNINPTNNKRLFKALKNSTGLNIDKIFKRAGNNILYRITFKDTSGKKYIIEVHYYNKLANAKFLDSSGSEHDFEQTSENYEGFVTRVISLDYLAIDKANGYDLETFVTVSRAYTDGNGNTMTIDIGKVATDYIFNSYGTYTVTFNNVLNTKKTYQFQYIQSDSTFYSVKIIKSSGTITLTPSTTKYSYSGNDIEQYFTIYDSPIIDVNQNKDLTSKKITEAGSNPMIYEIYSKDKNAVNKYDKFIAITIVNQTTNLLQGKLYVDDVNVTINSAISISKTATLTIPAYYSIDGNKIEVTCIVSGTTKKLAGTLASDGKTITFNFTSAGTYQLYFSDLAGNSHTFSGVNYFTLKVVNNFIYDLNGTRGIYNSVYNGSVTLLVEQPSTFMRIGSSYYTLGTTLNGSEYTPTYSNGSYLFSDYGTYVITLIGYVSDYVTKDDAEQKEDSNKIT